MTVWEREGLKKNGKKRRRERGCLKEKKSKWVENFHIKEGKAKSIKRGKRENWPIKGKKRWAGPRMVTVAKQEKKEV